VTTNVGGTVAFTASATDTDQPPQKLTFSLLLNGPGNATLNTNTGAFYWRPAVTNANTTNAFTLKVADNGTPILSATQSFTVTVKPLTLPTAASIVLNNGQLGFQISGQTGPDYAVQVSSNLFNWSTLFITNSPPMPFQWTDTNAATLPAQFYRIKVGPPLP
jgi:Flp pilus assembly protein TadG